MVRVPSDFFQEIMASGGSFSTGEFSEGCFKSFVMVLLSEIGDKTFFIAAVMAMKNPRSTILAGALGALVVMTVLSAGMGWAAPNLISKYYTNLAAVVLFFFFGGRLIYDSLQMSAEENWGELKEVEEEFAAKGGKKDEPSKKERRDLLRFSLAGLVSPIFIEAFTLTFLAEWGDRSQLATIGLAASTNVLGVTLGGILGHTICTGVAVCGGCYFATSLSERMVGLCGGILFILFGLHAFLYGEE